MNTRNITSILAVIMTIAGCGGGGGTATPVAPPVVVNPQPVAQNAGIFIQPAAFTTIDPSTDASAAQAKIKAASSKVAASVNFPNYNPTTQTLTVPDVKVDETFYSAVQLHLACGFLRLDEGETAQVGEGRSDGDAFQRGLPLGGGHDIVALDLLGR